MKFLPKLFLAALSVMLPFSVNMANAADVINIRIASLDPSENIRNKVFHDFSAALKENCGDKIKVELFHSGMLGNNDVENYDKMLMGAIDMVYISTSNMNQFVPDALALDMPYLMEKSSDNKFFYNEQGDLAGPIYDHLAPRFLKKNLKLLLVSPVNFRIMALNRDARTIADVKGLKLRCTSSPHERAIISAFGMSPVAMGTPEVYTSMQQRVIDGADFPLDLTASLRLHEVSKVLLDNTFASYILFYCINNKRFNSYPDWAQKAILAAMKKAHFQIDQAWDAHMEATLSEIKKNSNVTFYQPTPEEMKEWAAKAGVAKASFESRLKKDWIRQVYTAMGKEYR